MQIKKAESKKRLKDIGGLVIFAAAVLIGAWMINLFVFRSFDVDGPSMQDTLFTGDRLIVNRLPVTWSNIQGTDYIPERGQIIVFKNPHFDSGESNIEYIVKRVVAFPGEHVVVGDGKITVYNDEYPDGFNFDDKYPGALQPTDGEKDTTVPEGSIFVAGDHRQGGYSYDSRNGLGFIPFEDIVGPVSFRIYPFTQMRSF